jgi:hypothetical protein
MRHLVIFVLSIVSLAACAHATEKVCTQEEAIQAETESSTLQDWDSVYQAFRRFAHCDDGAISEGYSDSIARLLTRKWDDIGRADALTANDKKFESFVLRHIDDLMSPVQAKTIEENARIHCPTGVEHLCKQIESRLSEVDRNLRQRK